MNMRKQRKSRKLSNATSSQKNGALSRKCASVSELARELGVHRHTVGRWLAKSGNPGRDRRGKFDVGAWREWASENTDAVATVELSEARARVWEARARILERDAAEREGGVYEKSYVERQVAEIVLTAKSHLLILPSLLPPLLEGCSKPEICEILKREIHEVLRRLSEGFQKEGFLEPEKKSGS